MAAVTLTDTETEVFSGRVLAAYQHRDYFQEDWLMFRGQTATEVINQPVIQEGEAANIADGTTHDTQSATITAVEVPLVEPIKSYSDILKTQVDIRPDLNLLQNVGAQLGRDVGIGRTLRIANHMMDSADANGNRITGDFATVSGMGVAVKAGLQEVAAQFDDLGIDDDMRFGMIKPTQFYALRGETDVISSDFTQGQNINQAIGGNMSIVNYLNFTIRNMGSVFGVDWTTGNDSKNLPAESTVRMAFDATDIIGLFWHQGSTMVRHQTGLQASVDWIQREQAWMAIARLHMGIRVVKTDGVWILEATTA